MSEEDKLDLDELKLDLGSDAKRSSLDGTGHFESNPNSRPCSAPPTPFKVKSKLKVSLFDSKVRDISASLSNIKSVNMSHMNEIKPLRGSVSSYKSWITRNLNQITKAKDESTLSIPFLN